MEQFSNRLQRGVCARSNKSWETGPLPGLDLLPLPPELPPHAIQAERNFMLLQMQPSAGSQRLTGKSESHHQPSTVATLFSTQSFGIAQPGPSTSQNAVKIFRLR